MCSVHNTNFVACSCSQPAGNDAPGDIIAAHHAQSWFTTTRKKAEPNQKYSSRCLEKHREPIPWWGNFSLSANLHFDSLRFCRFVLRQMNQQHSIFELSRDFLG